MLASRPFHNLAANALKLLSGFVLIYGGLAVGRGGSALSPLADASVYTSYNEACSILTQLAESYPDIARLEMLGPASDGRPIPALLVTRNPVVPTSRPTIRLVGAHHGNEKISTDIILAVARHLCEGYDSDPLVNRLVREREFWLVPVLNPYGHDNNRRGNAHGIDLNRDYGYEWEVYPEPFSQPETRALRNLSERRNPTIELTYHSSASYVNYLWDNHPVKPPDSAWIADLARRYADSTYGSRTTQLRPINGFDWYEIHGSCQDYMYGIYGSLAYTIETRQPSRRQQVDSICTANLRAVLDIALIAGWGISGTVSDSQTHQPLSARVEIISPRRWHTYSNPVTGDFHRSVAPGTYDLRISANGYLPQALTGVNVPDTGGVRLNIRLEPAPAESSFYAMRALTLRRVDYQHTWSDWYTEALGPPDSSYYTLGSGASEIVLGLDPPVRNSPGSNLTIHATGSYLVKAGPRRGQRTSTDWLGPWEQLGYGDGTREFDLSHAGLDTARYLLIRNLADARLDAVSYGHGSRTAPDTTPTLVLSVRPNPARTVAHLRFGPTAGAVGQVRIYDISGREIRQYRSTGSVDWDLLDETGRPVADGIYFCRVELTGRSRTGDELPAPVVRKLVIQR